MPDFGLLAKGMLVGFAVAAAVTYMYARWAEPLWPGGAAWNWGIGFGLLAAGAVIEPQLWPPREDRARFLFVLVPLVLFVETVLANFVPPRWQWAVRGLLATAAAPILLYDSVYLADHDGPASAIWTRGQAVGILLALGIALTSLWSLMSALQSRTSTRGVQSLLALDAAAAALTVMLCGYLRAGALGAAMAAAIAGSIVASYFAPMPSLSKNSLGVSVIGLFSIVVIGRFFGSLPTSLATGLLAALPLAWVAELPCFRTTSRSTRGVIRLACVVAPLLVVLLIAHGRFNEALTTRAAPR